MKKIRWIIGGVGVLVVLAVVVGQLMRVQQARALEAALAAPPTTGTTAITLRGNAFASPNIAVPLGATVTWTNGDSYDHNVVLSNPTTASPRFGQGQTWQMQFTTLGMYNYACTLHSNMRGRVTVLP